MHGKHPDSPHITQATHSSEKSTPDILASLIVTVWLPGLKKMPHSGQADLDGVIVYVPLLRPVKL
jgi:hypothetical protein